MEKYSIPQVSCRLVLREGEAVYRPEPMDSPEGATHLMKSVLQEFDREVVAVVNLDNGLRPINWHIVSMGSLTRAEISIPEIFKTAILSNASKIMVFHNHPSGDPEPSREDDNVTKAINKAAKIMGIPLIDHIIIGAFNEEYYSYHRHGKIK